MDNIFNTDSGLRPPSPLTFSSAPGGFGFFGEPLGYEDFRFPNQDFLNMPASPALGSSSASGATGTSSSSSLPPPPPLLPPGVPQNGMMMNMMMHDPSMSLLNTSEQRYFSQFLDTLDVEQDFTFDPSSIQNLPNLPLFTSDAILSLDGSGGSSNNHSYMMPSTSSSSSSLSAAGVSSSAAEPIPPQRHSVGTSMDFDITGLYNNDSNTNSGSGSAGQPGTHQQSIAVPAKRTKTSKGASTSTNDSLIRKGTPSNSETGNKIATPMSKLSLNNTQANQVNGNSHVNGSSSAPSKSKKNKREQEDDEEKRDEATQSSPPGSNNRRPQHHHRSSTSSANSATSRTHSQSQTQSQARDHERNNSLSDDYASDGVAPIANGANGHGNKQANGNGSSNPTPKRKPYKDLLTEEEKRANHIASEQKRRNTIRNGFKDMTEIIPDLKDVNSSKSTILFKAVDFIRYLERRNKNLQEKAHQLETRLTQKDSQQLQQQQQPYGMHHLQQQQQQHHQQQQHLQHQYQQQSQQQPQQHHHQHHQQQHQHQIFHNPGLDDKRFQEIPSVYPVAISR
ncbi:hypothetical protein BGZ49_010012 [Haplosporangium sp. Z 27]|nr:hypothetical protein BGZ49_010012 [Haplosporangium sp. Z 27]